VKGGGVQQHSPALQPGNVDLPAARRRRTEAAVRPSAAWHIPAGVARPTSEEGLLGDRRQSHASRAGVAA